MKSIRATVLAVLILLVGSTAFAYPPIGPRPIGPQPVGPQPVNPRPIVVPQPAPVQPPVWQPPPSQRPVYYRKTSPAPFNDDEDDSESSPVAVLLGLACFGFFGLLVVAVIVGLVVFFIWKSGQTKTAAKSPPRQAPLTKKSLDVAAARSHWKPPSRS